MRPVNGMWVQRGRTLESLGLEGYPSCYLWSRFGSVCESSGGKQWSEELPETGAQSREIDQLRGMNGASSSLKHVSTHKLSVENLWLHKRQEKSKN